MRGGGARLQERADAEKELRAKLTELEQLVDDAAVLSGAPYEDWRPWMKRRVKVKGLDEPTEDKL